MVNKLELDIDALIDAALPFAKKMLLKHGTFYPYACVMKPNGEVVDLAAYDGRERPPPGDLINLLVKELRSDASSFSYKATAIVYDVYISQSDETDCENAIAIAISHRDGFSRTVNFPYSLKDGTVFTEGPFVQPNENPIFQ